jgi:very-short-patch-repair endonuclease
MLWREARLIVELDGRDAHSTAAQLAADRRRQAKLEARGYTVVRSTWAQVRFEGEAVAAELRRRLTPSP